ncbi:acyl carrier protein [Shewanella sp. 0m-8]
MENQILKIIADILEEDTITAETMLDEDNWDSLNVISFIAAINSAFGLILDAEKTGQADSVSTLLLMITELKK